MADVIYITPFFHGTTIAIRRRAEFLRRTGCASLDLSNEERLELFNLNTCVAATKPRNAKEVALLSDFAAALFDQIVFGDDCRHICDETLLWSRATVTAAEFQAA